jgi:adenylate kinase family enzyme
MKRVLILGCSGAGKSTLARILGERTGLPVVHLDQHYWRAGWTMPSEAEWKAEVAGLAQRPAWIMDGNYASTFPERMAVADTVIALDFPTWLCLWRVLRRLMSRYGSVREDLPEGCPEQFDWTFLKFVARFHKTHRPQMLAAFQGFGGTKAILRSPAEVRRYLDQVRRPEPAR